MEAKENIIGEKLNKVKMSITIHKDEDKKFRDFCESHNMKLSQLADIATRERIKKIEEGTYIEKAIRRSEKRKEKADK